MIRLNKELLKGSFVLMISMNLFNLFNFIFQLAMVRLLDLGDYASLNTLLSILVLTSILSSPIQTVITKYSSLEDNKGKLKNIVRRSLLKGIQISLVIFVGYALISILVSPLLKINYFILLINGLALFFSFLLPINRGIMQGKKRFSSLGFSYILEASIKLIISIALVFLGFKLLGAVIAILLSIFLVFFIGFYQIKDILFSRENNSNTTGIYNYAKPVFIINLTIFIFFSIDIIIAKFLFPGDLAGKYSIASVLGKIVFLISQPITNAMFPLASEKEKDKDKRINLLRTASILIIGVSLIFILFYYLFSNYIVFLFSGRTVIESSSILTYLAISFFFLALSNLFLSYKMSIKAWKGYPLSILVIPVQIILLFISDNLVNFALMMLASSIIFLILSVYLIKNEIINSNSGI